MIDPTDLLRPCPAKHFKTFKAFLVQSPKGPSFSTIQSYAPNVAFHAFLPSIEVQSASNSSFFPAECQFFQGNAQYIPHHKVT